MNLRTVSAVLLVALAAVCASVPTASATIAITAEDEIYTGTVKGFSSHIILDGIIGITCTSSSFEGAIESLEPEEPVEVNLSSLVFTGCGSHTVTVTEPGTLELNATGEGDGDLISTGAEITVLTHSIFLGTRHCVYATEETDLGAFNGGNPAVLSVSSEPVPASTDALCGSEAELTGSYAVTAPVPLKVVKPETTLCKESPENKGGGKFKCPKEQEYAGTIIGELTGPGNLEAMEGAKVIGTISCEKIDMTGKFTKKGAADGGVSAFTLTSGVGGACSSNLTGNPKVVIAMVGLPYERSYFFYWAEATGNGRLMLTKGLGKGSPAMSLTIGGVECQYEPETDWESGSVLNGAGATPTTVNFSSVVAKWIRKTGGAPCPPLVRWNFKLNLLRPGKENVYIASE